MLKFRSLKLLTFLSTLSSVMWVKYSTLLFINVGFTRAQAGGLKTFGYLCKLFVSPLWSMLADWMGDPTWALILTYIIGAATLELSRNAFHSAAAGDLNFNRMICVRLLRSSTNASVPLTDALILHYLGKSKVKGESYGRQRLFASVAWGVGALAGGVLVDYYNLWVIFPFTYVCYGSVLLLLLMMKLSERKMSKTTKSMEDENQASSSTTSSPLEVLQSTKRMLTSNSEIFTFAFQIVFLGFVMVLVDTVLPLQIEAAAMSRSFNGFTTLVSIIATIPIFWHSERIYGTKGASWMFRVAYIALMMRLLLLSTRFGSSKLYIVLVQAGHGVSFSMGWIASTEKMQAFAKSNKNSSAAGAAVELTATAQALVTALYFTCGQGVGNIFWLKSFDLIDHPHSRSEHNTPPKALYLFGATLVALNLVFFLPRMEQQKNKNTLPS